MGKRIAVSGGIGAGKSTVIKLIKDEGYSVFSCDEIYKEILLDKEYVKIINETFEGVVKNGEIDKRALANIVFNDGSARETLDALSHPRIMSRLLDKMENCEEDLVFAEVPLLFEGGYENLFDGIIVVIRNQEERIHAVEQRDKTAKADVLARIATQFDYEAKENQNKLNAPNVCIIKNEDTLDNLKSKLLKCLNFFKN